VGAPPSAAAQAEGREHFTRGLALYREGNFGGALAEFQRAYDVAPSYRILFNLGQADYELQDYAGALKAFARYLDEGADKVPANRRAEVQKTLRDLEQRTGKVEVSTNVPDAEIAVDDVPVGKTPLAAPLVVSVGRRRVTATLAGRTTATRVVDVAGGDLAKVSLELLVPEVVAPVVVPVPVPAPVVVPPPPPPPPKPPPPSMTPVWVGVGTTGALVVATAVFGALTVSANSTYNADLGTFPGSPSAISTAQSHVHTYGVAADILGGVAIAGAGVTTYLWLSRREPRAQASVGVSPAGGTLRVTF
jgi:hypothetical protein